MAFRILHLIDSGGLYGAEKMLLALVAEQLKIGLQPMILSAGAPGIKEKALEREARRLGLPVTPWRMRPGFNPLNSVAIVRWAKAEKYELFHSHGYKFNVLFGLLPRFLRKIPLVTTLHGYVKAPKYSKSWVYETLDRVALRRMSSVVLVAEAMGKDIPKNILSSDKVTVIANGLDIEGLERAVREPISSDLSSIVERHSPVLMGVGRLSYEKGFDRLIDALKVVRDNYPDAGLIIIGDGNDRERLEEQVTNLGLAGSVYLPGYCTTVPALMARADLLCMPSRTEGLPITLLEAMAVGVPLCVSDVGEVRTVLEDGRGGVISSLGSADVLAEDLLRSLRNKGKLAAAAEWSRGRVRQTYSAWNMAEKYMEVYQRVL